MYGIMLKESLFSLPELIADPRACRLTRMMFWRHCILFGLAILGKVAMLDRLEFRTERRLKAELHNQHELESCPWNRQELRLSHRRPALISDKFHT